MHHLISVTGGRLFLWAPTFQGRPSCWLSVTSDQLLHPPPLLNSIPPSPHGSTQQYRHPLMEGEGKQTDMSYVTHSGFPEHSDQILAPPSLDHRDPALQLQENHSWQGRGYACGDGSLIP